MDQTRAPILFVSQSSSSSSAILNSARAVDFLGQHYSALEVSSLAAGVAAAMAGEALLDGGDPTLVLSPSMPASTL